MRKTVAFLVFLLLALALWHGSDFGPQDFYWEGEEIDGPASVLLVLALAGAALVLAALAIGAIALMLGVVAAGAGLILLVLLLGLGLLVGVLCSPALLLLLPVLLYGAIRSRQRRPGAAAPRA